MHYDPSNFPPHLNHFKSDTPMIARTLFGPEHETFRDSVRRFMDTEVKPNDERW